MADVVPDGRPERLPELSEGMPDRPPDPLRWTLPTAASTRALGVALGRLLCAGDLLVLTGDLGAGKTTLAQGLGEGLGVRGPITSPTFVIARIHPSLVDGPALVHVDAYRVGGGLELDDLDLDASVEESVTVVEWGHGVAEALSADRLELVLEAAVSGERRATLTATGARWDRPEAVAALAALAALAAAEPAERTGG